MVSSLQQFGRNHYRTIFQLNKVTGYDDSDALSLCVIA